MSDRGDHFVLDGPCVDASEITWLVQSQKYTNQCYYVSIAPKAIMSIKNKREYYKNFIYKCTCEDHKVKVAISLILSAYSDFKTNV